jgi:hypothetical protein
VEMSYSTNGRQANSKENFNLEPKKTTKLRAPTVKMGELTDISRRRTEPKHGQIHKNNGIDPL